jgi:hypothetical protein
MEMARGSGTERWPRARGRRRYGAAVLSSAARISMGIVVVQLGRAQIGRAGHN